MFQKIWIFEMLKCQKMHAFKHIWDFASIIGSLQVFPKINIFIVGSHGHVRKSEQHKHEGVLGFPHHEIEKLLIQNEAE